MRRILAKLALGLLMPCAFAEEEQHAIDVWLTTELGKAANQTTMGAMELYVEASTRWDTELNRVYQELRAKLDVEALEALRQAQLAWITFRDREFTLIRATLGKNDGSIYKIMVIEKGMRIVRDRALELSDYLREAPYGPSQK